MDTKYKITISEGCTAFYTEVNGKIVGGEYVPSRLSVLEEEEFVDYLLFKVKEGLDEGTISLDSLIDLFQYERYETSDYACEQCGDYVTRRFYEL